MGFERRSAHSQAKISGENEISEGKGFTFLNRGRDEDGGFTF